MEMSSLAKTCIRFVKRIEKLRRRADELEYMLKSYIEELPELERKYFEEKAKKIKEREKKRFEKFKKKTSEAELKRIAFILLSMYE